ncbi:hypothetical protein MUK42_26463 [Musa troglodytarum]|uniref:Uncharacterized protein n=1 Tax=Musa troglodytarum TaxID=320322 RepID=A0A9E7JLY5_9LILI|nr:hypothetical protein MUK42_26463 [Musa troglodytarum]
MAMLFNLLSYWLWGRKGRQSPKQSLSSSSDYLTGYRDPDSLKIAAGNVPQIRSNSGRTKWKSLSREQQRVDKEYDAVLVPSRGECMGDFDDPDWAIGWLEPHASEFQSESETENSFAVLVPCYTRGCYAQIDCSKKHVLGTIGLDNDDHSGKRGIDFISILLHLLSSSTCPRGFHLAHVDTTVQDSSYHYGSYAMFMLL